MKTTHECPTLFHLVMFSTGYNSNHEHEYGAEFSNLPSLAIGNDNARIKLFANMCEYTNISKIKSDDDTGYPNLNQRLT